MQIYEILQFSVLTKRIRKKKKKRLIKDKVQIENAEMNNKMTITIS